MGQTARADGAQPALWLEKENAQVADGAVSDDGLVWGTYLHGLFDSDAFTRALVDSLRARKGLLPLETAPEYASYKAQQFDQLAQAMRQHVDIARIYQIMREHQECKE